MAPTNAQTALAGADEQQPPNIGAPSAELPESSANALSGDFSVPSPVFASKVAQGANSAAASSPQPNKPGAWSRAILGGVMDALSGFIEHGGAGEQAAQNQQRIQARQDQQKQQAIENQQKQQQMSREEAISRATIAHENVATTYQQQLSATLNADNRAKNVATGKTSADAYISAGAPVIQDGLDSDEIQNFIATKKLDPTKQHAFPTGEKLILDANGQQEFDQAGNALTRPTYTIFGDVPEITLSADQSKLISENTAYKLPEGTKMSGLVGGHILQLAASAQTATDAINEARNEEKLKELTTDEKLNAQKILPDWSTALAKTGNDPFKALAWMQNNPQMKSKHPDAATLVQSLYGGPDKWQDMQQKRDDLIEKANEDKQKKLASSDYQGDPNANNPQEFLASLAPEEQSVVKMIGEGRAPINRPDYLLARKPEVLAAVAKAYPGFDQSKVGSYQKTYSDYTSGKVSEQLTSGATALQHLQELKQLNTYWSRNPLTAANKSYQNKVDTVAAELARFYGNTTEQGIKSYRDTLNSSLLSRNSAIETQAKSMGDRLDNLRQEWDNAAPSKAYEAPMPGVSSDAKKARAALDPNYAQRVISVQIPGHEPGHIKEYLLNDFLAKNPDAKVIQ